MNLCINAKEAMPDGGIIKISTINEIISRKESNGNQNLKAGKYVVLTVKDTGYGINEKIKAKMFDPIFTTKKRVLLRAQAWDWQQFLVLLKDIRVL